MIHLGGDEVDTSCWTEVPAIRAWLEQRGLSADSGYGYFVNRTAQIAVSKGRLPVQVRGNASLPFSSFYSTLRMITLPRQARDKHRGKAQNWDAPFFSQVTKRSFFAIYI
eukprot:COSAG06_NODE_1236_length_10137_cov_3.357342_7_plen_110_part_00